MATLDPAEHIAQIWLPWQQAMEKVFSPTNRDAIWQLPQTERAMTCAAHASYAWNMSAMIQIRNVPDTLHRRLKSRAALAGMSLSDYLLDHLRVVAEQPTIEELESRLERLPPLKPSISPAEAVRAERDRR